MFKHIAKALLRNGVAEFGGLPIPANRLFVIACDAPAIFIHETKTFLRQSVTTGSCVAIGCHSIFVGFITVGFIPLGDLEMLFCRYRITGNCC